MNWTESTSRWVNRSDDREPSRECVQLFLAAALAAAFGRALLEVLFVFRDDGLPLSVAHVVDFAAYYLAIGMSVACVLRRLGQLSWNAALTVCSLGYALAILPPVLDTWLYGIGGFRYLYGSEVPVERWCVIDPQAMPVGEMTALLLVAAGSAISVGLIRRSPSRAALTLLAVLVVVFWHVYGLPFCARSISAYTMPVGGGGNITLLQVLWFMLVRTLCTGAHARYLVRRMPHILPWGLALCLGAALAGTRPGMMVPVAVCACLIFQAMIIENDLCDVVEDAHSTWTRPYGGLDVWLSRAGMFIALVILCDELDIVGLAFCLFYLTGLLYSLPPIRIKARPFPAMYLLEGFWGTMVVLAGAEFSAQGSLHDSLVAVVIGGGFILVSMIKDRKDVEGDQTEGIPSIYCVLLARGWTLRDVNRIVALLASGTLCGGCGILLLHGIAWLPGLVLAALGALATGGAILWVRDGRLATSSSLWAVNVCLLGGCLAVAGV